MAEVLKAPVDPWRIAAMLLYMHKEAAEDYAEARQAQAQAENDLEAARHWRMARTSITALRQTTPHLRKRLH